MRSRSRRLQHHPISLTPLKRHPQLQQLNDNIPKLAEKNLIISRIPLDMLLEDRILDKRHIRRQHHQALRSRILVLAGPVPFLEAPFLAQQEAEVVVADDGGGEGPRARKAAAVGVAAAEGVGAA